MSALAHSMGEGEDKWVEQSRKTGEDKGKKSHTAHLEGLNWEVIVVDHPQICAFCLPGGKIVVYTGLLENFRADAEIATVIGHEVGHLVARHFAEEASKFLLLHIILRRLFTLDFVSSKLNHYLIPLRRRMEMEADYIGLLLLASAGYDPRVAPQVYEKIGRLAGESSQLDYATTHPTGRKRAQLLSEAKVMEEALSIYREVLAGRGV